MAVKYIWRSLQQDLATSDLKLEAKIKEGFEIFDIAVDSAAANTIAVINISDEVITGLPCYTNYESIVPIEGKDTNTYSFIKTIRNKFADIPTYKVSEGKKFILSSKGVAATGYITYRKLIGEDIPEEGDPGTAEAKERLVVSHGKVEWSIPAGATETKIVNTSLNPTGIDAFPFGDVVPARKEIDILGFATSKGQGSGANVSYAGLRFWLRNESILSEEEYFVNPSLFPYNTNNINKPMFLFPEKLHLSPLEELKIEVKGSNSGAAAQNCQIFFTFILLVKEIA